MVFLYFYMFFACDFPVFPLFFVGFFTGMIEAAFEAYILKSLF